MKHHNSSSDTRQAAMNENGLFFLDSGAHSLYNEHIWKRPEQMRKPIGERYSYYDTDAFWAYVDAYAAFVKEHLDVIDLYANVDVIYHPQKSWEVQRYLEDEHGLSPVPVVHYGCPLKWVDKYLNAGYAILGVGGLGQGATKETYTAWADRLFAFICPRPSMLPTIKTHGFAMTAYDLMLRFPWWSVDSATWTKVGAFGGIMVPHKRGGQFVFDVQPYIIAVSNDSPSNKQAGKHYQTLSKADRAIVAEWLELIDVPLGKSKADGTVIEYGVCNRHSERKIANLLFFERLRAWLPAYPWPFKATVVRGHGL